MCVCVCIRVWWWGGGLCNIVVEFHIRMKLVTLIKIYVNESCSTVRIGKTLSATFPVQNGLNRRIKVAVYWPMAIAFVQKLPLGMSKQTRRE